MFRISRFYQTNLLFAAYGFCAGVSLAAGPPSINLNGVVNAANYASQVAPGSIASVFGNFLVPSPVTGTTVPLITNLAGLSLSWVDVCSPDAGVCATYVLGGYAPLFFVSNGQVNLQVPWEMPVTVGQTERQGTLVAVINGQTSVAQIVTVARFAPGIFTLNSLGTGQGEILDTSYRLVDPSNPAAAGDYLLIYCTGLGPVTYQPPTGGPALTDPLSHTTTAPAVTIGGIPGKVGFSGLAPGYIGLYQVNVQVPAGLAASDGVPVAISIGGVSSNSVTIAVK